MSEQYAVRLTPDELCALKVAAALVASLSSGGPRECDDALGRAWEKLIRLERRVMPVKRDPKTGVLE